jgi:spore germination protein YaaH
MDDVMAFATSVVSPNQVYVGIHFYGHDWAAGASTADSLTWESARALIETHGVIPQRKNSDGWMRPVAEPWFTYTAADGQRREVWYADAASVTARLKLVEKYGLGGVVVWRLGGEDPSNWLVILTHLAFSSINTSSTTDDSPTQPE